MPSLRNTRPISKTRSKPPTSSRLSGQLERDAQVGVEVEGVVVGDERSGGGPALLEVEDRRLDLEVVASAQLLADGVDRGDAHLEDPTGVGVDDEVDVALAVAGVDVGEALPLVGQRAQRLGQQLERARP